MHFFTFSKNVSLRKMIFLDLMFSLMFFYGTVGMNKNDIYSFFILWHMCRRVMNQTGRNLIRFSLSYFLLKMISVKNKPHCHKNSSPVWPKLPNNYDMISLQNQQFIHNTLQEQLLQMFCKIVGVFKNILKLRQFHWKMLVQGIKRT